MFDDVNHFSVDLLTRVHERGKIQHIPESQK